MKTSPIFLASSYELQPEREKFEIFIGRKNKILVKKNVRLELEVWEDMGSELNKSRKQDDYIKKLQEAEIVVVLFWTKMGKFTREEFDLAYERFMETGKPLIYVYEKTVSSDKLGENWEKQSKADFLKILLTPGKEQFHNTFSNYGELEAHFLHTLDGLFADNRLTFGEKAKLLSMKGPLPPAFFIGREKELETISEKFKKKGQVVLLSAEGGLGKTTLGSKYWYENQYSYGNCVYLFCEGGILNAIIGDGLGMDLTGLSDKDRLRQLHRLFNILGEDFLLFLDNVNDAEDIQFFLLEFSGLQANVLITSRCRDVMTDMESEMHLEHLSPRESKELFLEYYKEDNEDFDQLLDRFLEGINYHTLLIEVFAKNLKEASELGMNLKGFLKELEVKGLILEEDNNFEIRSVYSGNLNRKAATTNDILEILYDFTKLSEEDRRFLVNMSLLPSENYTMQFLLELFKPEKTRTFVDALKGLYRKGWIGGTQGEKPLYRLSPVIQNLVQIKNGDTLWEDGRPLFLRLRELLKYEDEKYNTHTKFKWIPFGKYFAELLKENDHEDFIWFLNHIALILNNMGGEANLVVAKEQLEKALFSDIRNFGQDSPSVAISRSNLALVLQNLGSEANLLKAKEQVENALSSDLQNFGEDSHQVAKRRSNLATVLRDLGGEANLLEAKEHLGIALSSDIGNSGEDSPAVATRRSNLATVLQALGGKANLLEAKEQLEKALSSDIRNFGEDSSSVAIKRSNLAMVLMDLGGKANLLEAKEQLEKALSSDIRNFGEDSSSVAIKRSNLAMVLKDLGGKANLLEAKEQFEKALSSNIRNLDNDSPSVAKSRSNLAFVLEDLGGEDNLLEAKEHLEKALSSNIRNFGEESLAVAKSRSNLALVLKYLGGEANLLEAKELYKKALSLYIRNFGEDSTSVALIRSNLATALRALGGEANLKVAKGQLEKALFSDIRNSGENSPAVAISRSNLALVLRDLGGEDNLLGGRNILKSPFFRTSGISGRIPCKLPLECLI